MTEADSPTAPTLIEQLERSRAALLGALTERTEQDFARSLGADGEGETLGHALAALAAAERADLAVARSLAVTERVLPEKLLPPQVTHDLAGARHQTLTHLGELDSKAALELVDGITTREAALVAAIETALAST
jgi:hypothetical protein